MKNHDKVLKFACALGLRASNEEKSSESRISWLCQIVMYIFIKNMLFSQTYNVMKNVSTHSMINTSDGELDMKLELEDIGRNLPVL
jgi:hypothetical protein